MSQLKTASTTVMTSSENYLEEPSEKEFKRVIVSVVKPLKEEK